MTYDPNEPGASAYQPPSEPSPQQPPPPGYNVLAILALVFAFVFAPAGIVLGHVAKRQIRRSGEQGDAIATVGLVLSYIFTGLAVVGCCVAGIALVIAGAQGA